MFVLTFTTSQIALYLIHLEINRSMVATTYRNMVVIKQENPGKTVNVLVVKTPHFISYFLLYKHT